MKKIHIITLVIVMVALGAIVSTLMNNATYSDFTAALQYPDQKYTVAGDLEKEKEIDYKPQENPNIFSFYMKDKSGKAMKVILNQAKPYDFERAESLVVTGKITGNIFYATEVLMKCPSKYNEQKSLAKK